VKLQVVQVLELDYKLTETSPETTSRPWKETFPLEDTPFSLYLTIELIARVEIQLLWACNNRLVSRNCLFCARANANENFCLLLRPALLMFILRTARSAVLMVKTKDCSTPLYTWVNYQGNRAFSF
jgi:hypothetical protein